MPACARVQETVSGLGSAPGLGRKPEGRSAALPSAERLGCLAEEPHGEWRQPDHRCLCSCRRPSAEATRLPARGAALRLVPPEEPPVTSTPEPDSVFRHQMRLFGNVQVLREAGPRAGRIPRDCKGAPVENAVSLSTRFLALVLWTHCSTRPTVTLFGPIGIFGFGLPLLYWWRAGTWWRWRVERQPSEPGYCEESHSGRRT